MNIELTDRQWEYVDAIQWFFDENDQFPPCPVLAGMVGSTNNAAGEMMQRLCDYGVVAKNMAGRYKRGPHWPMREG